MEFNRRVRDRMSLILLLLGNIATVALSGLDNKTGLNLDCTNDFYSRMYCSFDAQNCTEYKLILRSNDWYGEQPCITKQCDTGSCCCDVQMLIISGETHTATVFKEGQSVENKTINVLASVKPQTPTIISVKESNENFEVKWEANCKNDSLRSRLSLHVTYHKKGDTKEISEVRKRVIFDGPNSFDILGKDLEPSTTYMVKIKTQTDISGLFSDSSEEHEFTTSVSHRTRLWVVISCLSIAAVIITIVAVGCFEILKAKWWDIVAKYSYPELLDMHQCEQKVLKPLQTSFSSVSIDAAVVNNSKPLLEGSLTESSSGMSTGSSSANIEPADIKAGVQDALSKAFAHLGPKSSMTAYLLTESNKDSISLSATYNPCVTADDLKKSPESTDFDNMTYSIRIPSCQIMMNSSENQTQAEMLCDSAYHPSEGDVMTCLHKQTPACPDPVQQDIILPPVVSSLLPTDMSYQCSPDQQAPVQSGQCLSEHQRPFLSLISADQSMSVITDSDYHSV